MADEQMDPIGVDPMAPEPQQAPEPRRPEPRVWSLGDVLLITMMCLIPLNIFGLFFGKRPLLMLVAQAASFGVSLLCARVIISLKTQRGFFESVEWNYPGAERLPQLLLVGMGLGVVVVLSSAVVPIPKNLPIEKMFETRRLAIASMGFATIVAPFAEELYFRGIFYGAVRAALEEERTRAVLGLLLLLASALFFVLAWRGSGSGFALFAPVLLAVGLLLFPMRPDRTPLIEGDRQTLLAVVLTASFFAFVHGAQLAHSWGPLLAIFAVGLVLTTIRVRLRSVAASWLVHTAYNGTLFLITWASTSGFRNMS